jgi:hypothetical protein
LARRAKSVLPSTSPDGFIDGQAPIPEYGIHRIQTHSASTHRYIRKTIMIRLERKSAAYKKIIQHIKKPESSIDSGF